MQRFPRRRNRVSSRLAVVLASFLAVALLYGESDNRTTRVTLFFTGMIRGNYGPCGCDVNPSGGFARRAGYAAQYSKDHSGPILHIDLGGVLMPRGPHSARVNSAILEALEKLPMSVVNLSPDDLFDWDGIAASELSDVFISTNLSPLDARRQVPRRYRVIDIELEKGTLRLGFLGISDPSLVKPNSGFTGMDPLEAIEETKSEVLQHADALVVLTDMPQRPDNRLHEQIARNNPEVIAVLANEPFYELQKPRTVNKAILLSSVERGRYLGQLQILFDESGHVKALEPDFIQLKAGVPEDQWFLGVQKALESYLP